ncbi:MAG TPA: hypothetical protein VGE12_09355 [Noviherbaspirillum sp.]
MEKPNHTHETGRTTRLLSGKTLLIGVAGGLAAMALLSMRERHQHRRYADRFQERRNPMHFFLAGAYPRRRSIDTSGRRPLFERRSSVYDAY